jgi:hypothetical protein
MRSAHHAPLRAGVRRSRGCDDASAAASRCVVDGAQGGKCAVFIETAFMRCGDSPSLKFKKRQL